METTVDEINDGIYRISTYIPDIDFMFNQFVIDADEPMLWHCGGRGAFPVVSEAAGKVIDVSRLKWISFGHYESDECGSMNLWLQAAPDAQIVQSRTGVMVSLMDMADRPPRPLDDGEVLDLGGKRVRWIDTPHVPHGWDAGVIYEETTSTLFCGDLFTATGKSPALTDNDIVAPAIAAEDMFHDTALTPNTAPTMRRLADLQPATLGLMHGPSFNGKCGDALRGLADEYERRVLAAV
jgi:flavorubredoxin